ncbi:hypothetical protein P9597_22815 [Aneurinibacillus migulanus]|uniref:hypothetical protein n=1 Tax=Aneurinibacillus migulanus TaxID=47500 RepID=UPI002E1DC4A1|nr:hypothetical protein [Aneurinibacillus migulanus]
MTQLTMDDLLKENGTESVHQEIILSPGELAAQGIKWTYEDARKWDEQIWKVYHRERKERGTFINWFQAVEIYKNERYNFSESGGKK